MIVTIHQPQYMPWCGYFHKIANADLFVLLDDVQFKKNEWQHRNRIRTSQGWQWLSVPNHYRFPERINEVRVDDTVDWRKKHWQAITTAYGKARWFRTYADSFERFYSGHYATMAEVAAASVTLLCGLLGIATPVVYSSGLHSTGASTERLVNICRACKADMYLSGSGGKAYLDASLFDRAGIAVAYQEFVPPRYPQHWACTDDEFVPGLSAIDLLFNCGPESYRILMGKP